MNIFTVLFSSHVRTLAASSLLVYNALAVSAEEAKVLSVELYFSATNYVYKLGAAPREKHYTFSARCVVGTNAWRVESDFLPNAQQVYAYDGKTVCGLMTIGAPKSLESYERLKKRLGFAGHPAHVDRPSPILLYVLSGKHPNAEIGVNLPWLAYCSAEYLRDGNSTIPLPGAAIQHVAESYGYETEIAVLENSQLPRVIEFRASKDRLLKAPSHPSIIRSVRNPVDVAIAIDPRVRYPEGFVRGRYEVVETTNVFGWEVPLSFLYEQATLSDSGERERTLAIGGTATNFSVLTSVPHLLSEGVEYNVTDYRFRHPYKLVDLIHYKTTNAIIPTKDAPHLNVLYAAAVDQAALDPVVRARFGVAGLYVTVFVLPIAIACAWQMRRKLQKTER